MQPVDRARRRESAAQPPRDAREIAPGQLRAAQAERLDEQHAVLARQARHQMVLVGPQLGIPVGEPDAHDVAALEPRLLAHRRHADPAGRTTGRSPRERHDRSTLATWAPAWKRTRRALGAEGVPGAGRYRDRARDQTRTARLLFDAELAAGTLAPEALRSSAVTGRDARPRRPASSPCAWASGSATSSAASDFD